MNRSFIPLFLSISFAFLVPVAADPSTIAMDLSAWKLETLKGAVAVLTPTTDAPNGGASLLIQPQSPGSGQKWLVQLDYPISVLKGKTYHLKFSVKSDSDRYVYLGVTQMVEPYAALCDGRSIEFGSTWQNVDFTFTPKADESEARLLLTNLNEPGAKYYLANVTLSME